MKSGAAYSIDQNLWGRSIEAGPLEDPWTAPPEAAYALTLAPERAFHAAQEVEITFEAGVPVAVDGEEMGLVELIARAAAVAGAHGVGRIDMIENRLVGIKSREVYETPAAALLLAAYAGVEELVCDRDLAHMKAELAARYATLVYNGLWFSPLRLALEAFMAQTSAVVTGTARVKLYRGSCAIVGRRAESALYDHGLATYEHGDSFQHGAAAGFIHIWSLPTKTWAGRGPVAGDRSGMTQALWSGRLPGGLDPDVKAFTASLAVDRRLLPYDLRATAAHVRMLAARGILDAALATEICAALDGVEISADATDEDVHSAIERELGELGRWVHAGRSRNDQVQTAMRLWVKDACDELAAGVRGLAGALLDRAERDGDAVLPGYTHGQRAQPVWLGQHLAAHVWALTRDIDRFRAVHRRADTCPSGAGALAGSSLPLDPAAVASELGFAAVHENPMDAVSDRDYCVELVFACTLAFSHLSRIAEELVLWTSAEYGFAELDDAAATGSSMMPQKKNPDAAELVRGRAGTAAGRLAGLLATLKGLPLAYNRDLQEDKRACFDAADDLAGALRALTVCIRGITFHPDRMAAAAGDGWCVATDVAEAMVREGTPFRAAHTAVAGRVAAGERFSAPAPAEAAAGRQAPDALRIQLARARAAVGDG